MCAGEFASGFFRNQGDPFSTHHFFMDGITKPRHDMENILALLTEDSRKDRQTTRAQRAMKFRKELDNEVLRQIAQKKVHRFGADRIDGPAERPHLAFRVALDI